MKHGAKVQGMGSLAAMVVAVSLAASLAACGGGGGGDASAPPVDPPANPPTTPSVTPTLSASVLRDPADTAVDGQVLNTSTGATTNLPRSARALQVADAHDYWAGSRGTGELIREDGAEGVDIFSWPALGAVASFKLKTQTTADERATLSSIRMSRDGKYMAAYEIATNSSRKNRPLVFNRSGDVLLTGSYQDTDGGGGLDWLPDGRLVYIDRGAVLVHDMATGQSTTLPVRFPTEAKAGQEGLAVSPDGKKLGILKWTSFKDSKGEAKDHAVLYVVGIDGGDAQALAQPAATRVESGLRLRLMDLSWSADGEWLTFAADVANDPYGGSFGLGGCAVAYAVKGVQSAAVAIDGVRDTELQMKAANGTGGLDTVQTCGLFRLL